MAENPENNEHEEDGKSCLSRFAQIGGYGLATGATFGALTGVWAEAPPGIQYAPSCILVFFALRFVPQV